MAERVRAGARICFVEPSCLAMIVDDWARLLPGDERVREVAAAAIPALAAVAELAEAGALHFHAGGGALLHDHCHAKALGFATATTRALACVPELRLEVLDAGCCGMAGVFGYEAGHYATSVAVGERVLAPAVRSAEPATSVLATGTSCRSQIADLTGRAAAHPLSFLYDRLDG
jgi:Fe-S oxidoreductase